MENKELSGQQHCEEQRAVEDGERSPPVRVAQDRQAVSTREGGGPPDPVVLAMTFPRALTLHLAADVLCRGSVSFRPDGVRRVWVCVRVRVWVCVRAFARMGVREREGGGEREGGRERERERERESDRQTDRQTDRGMHLAHGPRRCCERSSTTTLPVIL